MVHEFPFNQRPLLRATQEKKSAPKLEGIKRAQSNFLPEPLASELLERYHPLHKKAPFKNPLKYTTALYQQDKSSINPGQGPGEGLSNDACAPAIRVGTFPPELYLTLDRLSDEYGNHTMRADYPAGVPAPRHSQKRSEGYHCCHCSQFGGLPWGPAAT